MLIGRNKKIVKSLLNRLNFYKDSFTRLDKKYINFEISDDDYQKSKESYVNRMDELRIILIKYYGVNPEND